MGQVPSMVIECHPIIVYSIIIYLPQWAKRSRFNNPDYFVFFTSMTAYGL